MDTLICSAFTMCQVLCEALKTQRFKNKPTSQDHVPSCEFTAERGRCLQRYPRPRALEERIPTVLWKHRRRSAAPLPLQLDTREPQSPLARETRVPHCSTLTPDGESNRVLSLCWVCDSSAQGAVRTHTEA